MNTLRDLTVKYDVDALELGYTKHYSEILEKNISSDYNPKEQFTKVLEIGVETGRSHRLWLEYFHNAKVYGYDIFEYGVEEFHKLQKDNPYLDRSIMFKGDQSNVDDIERFLSEHGSDFDMIIDDGGHTMKQIQVSLNYLWNSLKSGGFYVIEDLHSCSNQWPWLYGYKVIEDGDTLTTDLLDSLSKKDNKITETNYIPSQMLAKIREELDWCETRIGVEKYTNSKGQSYQWPTMLSFMRKK